MEEFFFYNTENRRGRQEMMKVTIIAAITIILSLFAAGVFIAQILAVRRTIKG